MYRRTIALGVLALGFTLGARADEAGDLFARYKDASGGARWDAVRVLRSEGTLKAGGLAGQHPGARPVFADVERHS